MMEKNYISGIFMMVVSLIFIVAAYTIKNQNILDPAGSSYFPTLLAIVMFLCGVAALREGKKTPSSRKNNNKEGQDNSDKATINSDEDLEEIWDFKEYRFVFSYLLIIFLFVISINFVSFFISAFLFLITSLWFFKGGTLIKNIVISFSTVLVVYVLFKLVFKVVFP